MNAIVLKIKSFLEKHPRLDYMQKVILQANNPDFVKMVLRSLDDCTVQISVHGEHVPDVVVWPIRLQDRACGLFALIEFALNRLILPDRVQFVPVIEFSECSLYSEAGPFLNTRNAFEYYFEPAGGIRSDELDRYPNIITTAINCYRFAGGNSSYMLGEDRVQILAEMYQKYCRLNARSKDLIEPALGELLKGQRTLAVHVRGTDFRGGFVGHPHAVLVEQYLEAAVRVVQEYAFEQVFLATDEQAAVDAFAARFGDRLVYYPDTFRSIDGKPVHTSNVAREHHRYQLGLEALRDMLTIVGCDGLICGFSRLSNCARIAKHARGENFTPQIVMESEIVKNGPGCQD